MSGVDGSLQAAAAPLFAALSDVTRLTMVARLTDGRPRSITELTDGSGLSRQAVTKHLRVLQQAGIVAAARSGRERRFSYRPDSLQQARDYLDTVSLQWDDALARLKSFVET